MWGGYELGVPAFSLKFYSRILSSFLCLVNLYHVVSSIKGILPELGTRGVCPQSKRVRDRREDGLWGIWGSGLRIVGIAWWFLPLDT